MTANRNSVPPFLGGTAREALESIGITQFPSATEWYQVIGGLIVQGGTVAITDAATTTIPLVAPYEKQTLGVWIQVVDDPSNGAHVEAVTLEDFDLVNGAGARTYYWLSLGV